MDEHEFYQSGLFRGAIERLRGQFSATMRPKRDFVATILNDLQDRGFIQEWFSAGAEVVSRMLWKFSCGALRACDGSLFQAARSRGMGSMG